MSSHCMASQSVLLPLRAYSCCKTTSGQLESVPSSVSSSPHSVTSTLSSVKSRAAHFERLGYQQATSHENVSSKKFPINRKNTSTPLVSRKLDNTEQLEIELEKLRHRVVDLEKELAAYEKDRWNQYEEQRQSHKLAVDILVSEKVRQAHELARMKAQEMSFKSEMFRMETKVQETAANRRVHLICEAHPCSSLASSLLPTKSLPVSTRNRSVSSAGVHEMLQLSPKVESEDNQQDTLTREHFEPPPSERIGSVGDAIDSNEMRNGIHRETVDLPALQFAHTACQAEKEEVIKEVTENLKARRAESLEEKIKSQQKNERLAEQREDFVSHADDLAKQNERLLSQCGVFQAELGKCKQYLQEVIEEGEARTSEYEEKLRAKEEEVRSARMLVATEWDSAVHHIQACIDKRYKDIRKLAKSSCVVGIKPAAPQPVAELTSYI